MKLFSPSSTLSVAISLALCTFTPAGAIAADEAAHGDSHGAAAIPAKKPKVGEVMTSSASNPKEAGNQVREALGTSVAPNKKLTVVVSGKGSTNVAGAPINPQLSREYAQARAAAVAAKGPAGMQEPLGAADARGAAEARGAAAAGHGGEVHWAYDGENGPQNWGRLKPEFNVCAIGKRQSPINIQEGNTLAGPAEPVQFNYTPSNGTVVNNGHTIQVNVDGNNSITVRGSRYQLLQFHFHTPSEEQVNYKRYAMVAHLVHKNEEGQLAVVAVLLEPGESNTLINKVWTYMPLDTGDSVRMPVSLLDMNEVLPKDQRYYQFMGSLTTPPCTEGVLWMVLKQPVQISQAQYKLFTQLYPLNARPVQALNARPVRDAQ
jgi:carbonic anhydrase